jgi:acyl-CoA thioester hydrolase
MPLDAPFVTPRGEILPGWVNEAGHLDMSYYLVLFQAASDALFRAISFGRSHMMATGNSCFAAETHIIYESEMQLGDTASIQTTVIDADSKRLHLAHEMFRNGEPSRVCLQEIMFVSVSLKTRRPAPWPPNIQASLIAALAEHNKLPRPAKLARSVGIKR